MQTVSNKTHIAPHLVEMVYDHIVDELMDEAMKTGYANMPGLATLKIVDRKERKERTLINPRNNKPCVVKSRPASRVLKIKPVKAATDKINHVCV